MNLTQPQLAELIEQGYRDYSLVESCRWLVVWENDTRDSYPCCPLSSAMVAKYKGVHAANEAMKLSETRFLGKKLSISSLYAAAAADALNIDAELALNISNAHCENLLAAEIVNQLKENRFNK